MLVQVLVIILLSLSLGINWAKHGQPDKFDARTTAISTLVWVVLLWLGGFWEPLLGGN